MLLRTAEGDGCVYELLYIKTTYCGCGERAAPLQTLPDFAMSLLANEKGNQFSLSDMMVERHLECNLISKKTTIKAYR